MANTIKIEIVAGEGTGEGHTHIWTASLDAPAIRGRLTRERCRGDRWAYCRINGERVADDDIGDAILAAQETERDHGNEDAALEIGHGS